MSATTAKMIIDEVGRPIPQWYDNVNDVFVAITATTPLPVAVDVTIAPTVGASTSALQTSQLAQLVAIDAAVSLTTTQLAALTTAQVAAFGLASTAALQTRQIALLQLTTQQLGSLSSTDLATLTSRQLTALDAMNAKLPALSGTNLPVITPLGAPYTAQQKATASAVALPTSTTLNGVIVTASSSNTGSIMVGPSGVTATDDGTGNGYKLLPGQSIGVACTNVNQIYIIGAASFAATDFVYIAGN